MKMLNSNVLQNIAFPTSLEDLNHMLNELYESVGEIHTPF